MIRAPVDGVCQGRDRFLVLEEHRGVQDRRDDAAGDGTDDPDEPVGPAARGERRTEPACRVHRGTGVRTERHDVERDHEADREARGLGERATGIDRRPEDGEDQEERGGGLDHDALAGGDALGERWRSATTCVVERRGDQVFEQVRARHRAEELGADQDHRPLGRDLAGDPQADRDGRVHEASRDVRRDRDHDREHQTVRERHAGQVEPEAHRDHGARADEDQRERRHELRYRRLARALHACLLALDGRTRPTIAGSAERRSSG